MRKTELKQANFNSQHCFMHVKFTPFPGMRHITLLLIFLFSFSVGALGQTNTLIDLPKAPRVDTSRTDIRDLYLLWQSYLSAEPGVIKDSALWSSAEQVKYPDYDITRRWTYGAKSGGYDIHEAFGLKPFVLSIDPESDHYAIRTLYSADNLEYGVLTIQTVYASKENGEWKLRNALPIRTADWFRKQFGEILFIYPSEETFDESKAREAAAFVDSIKRTYELSDVGIIEYYVASDFNEMAFIRGLDYTWDLTDGTALMPNNQIFVGNGEEAYLHELVHILFKEYNLANFVNEGLATYLGDGVWTRPFGIWWT